MEITPAQTGTTRTATPERAAASALSSDFETFLKMLTVQMQNQDPLNPIESSDFAVQLATFSGVEQQVRTNDLLRDLSQALGGSAVAQYADWIGKEARSTGPVRYDGQPITVSTRTAPFADAADLVIADQSGRVVDRVPIDPRGGDVVWSGIAETGDRFLTGQYSFLVESRSGDTIIGQQPGETFGLVREARLNETGSVELLFDGGGSALASDVTGLRVSAR